MNEAAKEHDREAMIEMMVDFLWLEAKQVLRGCSSQMFPDLTPATAASIRAAGYDTFREIAIKEWPRT